MPRSRPSVAAPGLAGSRRRGTGLTPERGRGDGARGSGCSLFLGRSRPHPSKPITPALSPGDVSGAGWSQTEHRHSRGGGKPFRLAGFASFNAAAINPRLRGDDAVEERFRSPPRRTPGSIVRQAASFVDRAARGGMDSGVRRDDGVRGDGYPPCGRSRSYPRTPVTPDLIRGPASFSDDGWEGSATPTQGRGDGNEAGRTSPIAERARRRCSRGCARSDQPGGDGPHERADQGGADPVDGHDPQRVFGQAPRSAHPALGTATERGRFEGQFADHGRHGEVVVLLHAILSDDISRSRRPRRYLAGGGVTSPNACQPAIIRRPLHKMDLATKSLRSGCAAVKSL